MLNYMVNRFNAIGMGAFVLVLQTLTHKQRVKPNFLRSLFSTVYCDDNQRKAIQIKNKGRRLTRFMEHGNRSTF